MKKIIASTNLLIVLLSFTLFIDLFGQVTVKGKVYLVLGSDTAIWTGMNTSNYNCTYDQSLYTDPSRNAYTVMDPAFRATLLDSYGQPMKMTWWMMAGNIFRYAANTNVPVPNIMTLYLMKKYHGENVVINGDELSLHYHTFKWTDYDRDGIYYWNQSKTFLESLKDFEVTLAQFLIEEHTFPVSFRSGWHYMDNDWQNYLDERVLPYSMHNDYPAKRLQDDEPIDNIFDWSNAPSDFIPYHTSKDNYQVPGDGPGWQVRSASFQKVRANDLMNTVFEAADQGSDQVACFWAHLPESDFPDNMQMIDSLAHHYSAVYPEVEFQYCTAIEAMQLWRGTTDTVSPTIQLTDEISGESVYFNIQTDETIFQKEPFVAVKNIYNEYTVLECISTGTNLWKTKESVPLQYLVKAGVTVCDTFGNQSMEFLSYLPADKYIDNKDIGYSEEYGSWSTSNENSWGTDSRIALLSENDSAKIKWEFIIPQSGYYNIFIQFPDIDNRTEKLQFIFSMDQIPIDTIKTNTLLPAKTWNYLTTSEAEESKKLSISMKVSGEGQNGKILAADVIKISALVRDKDIAINEGLIDFGNVSVEDTVNYRLKIYNQGINNLIVSSISTINNLISINTTLPIIIPSNSNVDVELIFTAFETGRLTDTLQIISDDNRKPVLNLLASANVLNYFITIDDKDTDQYKEYGDWRTSVANIYGPSSRYAFLNSSPLASARFNFSLKKSGLYEIQAIVPKTVNSTDDALYELYYEGRLKAAFHIDQNGGSGNWVTLGSSFIPDNTNVELWIKDTGNSTKGDVIRTDAIRLQWIDDGTTAVQGDEINAINTYKLSQNYPNPFNPVTKIEYFIPSRENISSAVPVKLKIFDVLGREVTTLVNKNQRAGSYEIIWNGSNHPSGVYYYTITAGIFKESKKMILLK